MAENISDGDTIVVIKRNSKKFCTEPWHETMGEVEKIDGAAKKMAYIGYNTSVAGFNLTKICPFCRRIISVKQF